MRGKTSQSAFGGADDGKRSRAVIRHTNDTVMPLCTWHRRVFRCRAPRPCRMADLLGITDWGELAAGKQADIKPIGNPLQDLRANENVVFVMRGGKVYRRPE